MRGPTRLGPRELGLPQVPAREGVEAVHDRLALRVPDACLRAETARGAALTVGRASATAAEAAEARAERPGALAEEMEAFGVALAGHVLGREVGMLRGVSNVAGDADRGAWRVAEALAVVKQGLVELLEHDG